MLHVFEGILYIFEIVEQNVSCVLAHSKISLDGFLDLVFAQLRVWELFESSILNKTVVTLWRGEGVKMVIFELGFPLLILSIIS